MTFKASSRVVIVGAGLGGLAAAIGIRKAGFSVLVLEKVGELREVGAGIEIASNAARALDYLGVLDKVMRFAIHPHDIVLRSYRDGSILSKQNLVPYCMETYGYPHFDVHRADLHKVLFEEAERLGVNVKLNASLCEINFEKPEVRLSSGEVFGGCCIVGADGQNSQCRELLLGRADPPLRSGDLGFRMVLKAADMRKRPELHSLMEPPNINAWFGPHSHVVSYLLQRDDLFNIFLGGPEEEGSGAIGPQPATLDELRERFKGWDPRLQSVLELAQETRKWTMFRGSDLSTWTSSQATFALMGDAAHGMLPYLGQGAAQAFEDAAALGVLFHRCKQESDAPLAISLYEKLRYPRAMEVRRRSHAMRVTHGYPDGPLQRERDRLMKLAPFAGHPNAWADPVFQPWLWGYDAAAEANNVWDAYQKSVAKPASKKHGVLETLLSSVYSIARRLLRNLWTASGEPMPYWTFARLSSQDHALGGH